ncbi:MAG: hypothetical protein U0Q22_11590 [Acidimicrobiales bacterium]
MISPRVLVAGLLLAAPLAACVPDGTPPPVGTTTTTTIDRSCQLEFRTIKTAAEAYRAIEGRYPVDAAELNSYLTEPVDGSRWAVTFSATGSSMIVITGIGACAGVI